MGKFATITGGVTLQVAPINENTEENTFTDKSASNIDTIKAIVNCVLTFKMRSGNDITINAFAGEDFGLSEDVISFTSDGLVRIG